ncbi:hypothetical protein [Saccharothrix carnea]|uniref:hypothetical protein n=1 Tax=Saccharothrix carnea TaxID=1280637 RepID=UPI000D0CA3C4|nr:hypothetical protein [Saccharothrix carnea]
MNVERLQVSLADAAAEVADRVLGAVGGAEDIGLADYVHTGADTTTVLGAVRLIGADVFAPHVLLGRPVHRDDAAVVARSFTVYPPTPQPTTRQQHVTAWRDWAVGRLLARTDETSPAGSDAAPTPETAAALLDGAKTWQEWSATAAQLSPLALPGVGGPIVAAVFAGMRPLARGVTRAVLRRDFVTAARLIRWMALSSSNGVRQPLDPVLLVERIRLYGGTGSRLALDLAISRVLLRMEPA